MWFQDETAADQVGPRGLRPEELRPRQRRLDDWESSGADLFDWIRTKITPELLDEIARSDHDRNVPEHFAELSRVTKSGLVPLEFAWYPVEVLRLTRWSQPEDNASHLKRAFCCTLLYMSPSDDENPVDIGFPLIESCLALGEDAVSAAERFMMWLYETSDDDRLSGNEPAVVSLLLLLLMRAGRESDDRRLARLLMVIKDEGSAVAEWVGDSLKAEFWARMIEERLMPLHISQPQLSPLLDAIGFRRAAIS
jgi:hypothetical protein